MFGFLNLNKPAGWTSHDCVAKLRRLCRQKRVGHGGTLDPAATGVLPIALGTATRLLQYLPTFKQYQARIRFGVQTTTDDLEGEVVTTQNAEHLTLATVENVIPQFIGNIEQVPPAHSAIQRDGKRLYELARAGVAVDIPTRQVEVMGIRILSWQAGAQPELTVEIDCGSGTYIRAIARDLGTKLGVGGTLANLIRTQSCGLSLATSLTLAEIQVQMEHNRLTLIPPEHLLNHLTRIELDLAAAQRWCQGQKLTVLALQCRQGDYLQVHQANGPFLGIGQSLSSQECRPKTVIGQPGST
ncbi:MAG: tRNA pseudouridine(55) synthase TruB [Spirulina sp. SIO3F2]|nr:tRNA pseudouridine(55) synthase TruB [Spirulina sp. SIO3F2]